MKKLFKRVLSIFLSILVISLCIPAVSANLISSNTYNESELIAVGAPKTFGYNYDWSIVKETPLYDADSNIIAYCYDLKNQSIVCDDEPKTAYTVVNVTENGSVILMFGIDGVSPYFTNDYDKAYFFGALEYYGEIDGEIINITTEEVISEDALVSMSDTYVDALNDSSVEKKQADNYRTVLMNEGKGISTYSEWIPFEGDLRMLYSVPSLQWYRGCAPTSVAMMIMGVDPYFDSALLIDNLAYWMGTESNGSTSFTGIASGTYTYLTINNIGYPWYCGWNAMQSNGEYPKVGFTYNSKETFKSSIDRGYPVGVYVSSSSVVTPGYSNMGAHMMAGVGYLFDSTLEGLSGDYIICYTTNVADGGVFFPMTTSALNNVAWFLLYW